MNPPIDPAQAIPSINAIPQVPAHRPLVSVVIPTYEPGHYLRSTLRSVLDQDPGLEEMQIAVVDDASPRSDVTALIDGYAPPGRVELHRSTFNRGLADNWNECLRVARGEFVHILHQDDLVAPGFYQRLGSALRTNADIGMAYCRHAYIDSQDAVTRISHRERWFAGRMRNWLARISTRQRLQCAAALVRRSVYEELGGYRQDLCYALDWEMWVRIAARYAVWYDPRVLAFYRRHETAQTARLRSNDRTEPDLLAAIDTFAPYLPSSQRTELQAQAYARLTRVNLKRAVKALAARSNEEVPAHLQHARNALARLEDKRMRQQLSRKLDSAEARLRAES
jgi:glycosyltransferase involved in cell wall biosynthesis